MRTEKARVYQIAFSIASARKLFVYFAEDPYIF